VPRQRRRRPARHPTASQNASEQPPAAEDPSESQQRLDKWLWFARCARTRSLAARLVEDGKVRVNRQKILKPAQTVRPGDVVTAAIGERVRVLKIAAAGRRRGPAEEARALYEDLTPPVEPAPSNGESTRPASARPAGAGRPTKRERRRLDAVRAHANRDDLA
jgi:ribosome-associated heat shock protein Hsp15